jgi:ferredoxin
MKIKSYVHDFTPFYKEYQTMEFESDELLVIGVPVYSGRVPSTFVQRISYLKGNNTPVVLVATYGNRDYDDTLIELKTLLKERGFVPMAAAALVTEHNCYRKLAAGRPDEQDMQEIENFSMRILELSAAIDNLSDYELYVSGNEKYREYIVMPIQPHSTEKCNLCGICAEKCPSGAIPIDNPDETNELECIRCMACIRICPVHARELYEHQLLGIKSHLSGYTDTKVNEYFI